MSKNKERMIALELVRGIAALLVVFDHSLLTSIGKMGSLSINVSLAGNLGALGVYVFFVISGMVMVESHGADFGRSHPWRDFMAKRITRIVPLYWVCTLIYFAKESLTGNPRGFTNLLLSLFFIPHQETGDLYGRPVLGLGWTLEYEMAFYLLFAVALMFSKRVGISLIAGIILASVLAEAYGLLGRQNPAAFLAKPIILMFPCGIAIGLWRQSSRMRLGLTDQRSILFAMVLIFLGIIFAAQGTENEAAVPLALTAATIVAGCSLEVDKRSSAWLLKIVLAFGGSTYAIYLTHAFIIGPAARIFFKSGLSAYPYIFAFSLLPLTAILGHLVYKYVERPLIKTTARIIGSRQPRVATDLPGPMSRSPLR